MARPFAPWRISRQAFCESAGSDVLVEGNRKASPSEMSGPVNAAIDWRVKSLEPGHSDNFVSNTYVVAGVSAAEAWPLLADLSKWESYYQNVYKITPPSSGPVLKDVGTKFSFGTFGFPPLNAEIHECEAPSADRPGRLSWVGQNEPEPKDHHFECYHAWVLEDVPGDRLRIFTEETQNGKPVADLRNGKPNMMLLGHQDWVEGLAAAALGNKRFDKKDSNMKAIGKQTE